MTEDEAKTKSCCGPMQAEHGKTHVVNCIGSACMAWRWENRKLGHDIGYMKAQHGSAKGVLEWQRFCASEPLAGFCGLAGRP